VRQSAAEPVAIVLSKIDCNVSALSIAVGAEGGIVRKLLVAIGVCAGLALGSTAYAAPAGAKEPEQEVLDTIPAGFGCAFDVHRTVSSHGGNTADITLTNADTGQSYLWRSRYQYAETYDPVSNDVLVAYTGRRLDGLWPGDQGPNGEVQYPGMLLGLTGDTEYVFDLDTGLVTRFSNNGTITDICAALST
jgi:hypothetical protein